MTRHLIVARFGALETERSLAEADETATSLDFMSSGNRLDHGISQALEELNALSVFPTELGLDLVVLATVVYFADTRVSRATESQDTWTREIRVIVPVSDPARWRGASALVKRMLDFLTGDRWTVEFHARPVGLELVAGSPAQWAGAPFDALNLFSGGLDSLIGAIDSLERGEIPLLVSHAGEGATSDSQNACFNGLKTHYDSRPFARLRFWLNFPERTIAGVDTENTTRGRSFLFFALGAFAGTGFGRAFTVRVPENGLIAVNVPLDVLRLGSLSTRTAHPFYIARWDELLGKLGIPGRLENPYWNRTKGEMVASCAKQDLLQNLVGTSISCSAPTKARWQGHGIEQCGYCLPCLIRRAALEAAWGHGKDPTTYTLQDLVERALDTRRAEGAQVRSFQVAIARLRARPGLERLLVYKPGPLTDLGDRVDELADVYRRGMEEVAALLSGVCAEPS